MKTSYTTYIPEQQLLRPQALQDWPPEGHLAYYINDTVDSFELGRFTRSRRRSLSHPKGKAITRDKIKLESSAGIGHSYTTSKNKRTMPEKMEIMKFYPKAPKHVMYEETKLK